MNRLKQRYNRWKSISNIGAKRSRLSEGMSADAIRELLGEPDEVSPRQEGIKPYYEWTYSDAFGKDFDFVLLVDEDSNLVAPHKVLED